MAPSASPLGVLDAVERPVVTWVALGSRGPTIHVAGLTEALVLGAPLTVASPAHRTAPRMAVSDGGAWISWLDGGNVHGQRVTCR